MKRSTIVRHLTEIAERATETVSYVDIFEAVPLREIWVAGDVLDEVDMCENVTVVLMLDLPANELPLLALHRHGRFWEWHLNLAKHPLLHRYEPVARPAWNHDRRRVLRIWTLEHGMDAATLGDLRSLPLAGIEVVEPTPAELKELLEAELPRSTDHLREVLEHYWEGRWRKAHTDRSSGIHPDDHLWRAAYAVQSMQEALAALES